MALAPQAASGQVGTKGSRCAGGTQPVEAGYWPQTQTTLGMGARNKDDPRHGSQRHAGMLTWLAHPSLGARHASLPCPCHSGAALSGCPDLFRDTLWSGCLSMARAQMDDLSNHKTHKANLFVRVLFKVRPFRHAVTVSWLQSKPEHALS